VGLQLSPGADQKKSLSSHVTPLWNLVCELSFEKNNRDRCLVVVLVSKFDREYGSRFGRRKFEKNTTVTDAWLSFWYQSLTVNMVLVLVEESLKKEQP
jgi:hypothetical protein